MRVDAPNEGNCVNLEDRGGLKSPEGRQGCRKRWFTILVTFAVIFVAAALINYLFRSISGANQPPPSISAGQTNAEKGSVAIVPFKNIGPATSNSFIAEGMHEEINAILSIVPSLIVKDGSRFDIISSSIVTIGYAIPNFLFAVILIVFFAGGRFYDIFPLRGLFSENFDELTLFQKIIDYFWHLALPLTAMLVSGFAGLTFLTKNSFLDQVNQQYVITARSKGLTERKVLYGHVFRNAMLIVIAGFPSAFIGILFSSSLFIEVIFSLDGLGLLGYEAALTRDYPVIFATLYFFSLLGLVMGIIGDFMYSIIDPRIDFESRQ